MKDKILHLIVSMVTVIILLFLTKSIDLAIIITLSLGILKEGIDELFKRKGWKFWIIKGSSFSVGDIVADVIGCILGVLLLFLWAFILTGYNM